MAITVAATPNSISTHSLEIPIPGTSNDPGFRECVSKPGYSNLANECQLGINQALPNPHGPYGAVFIQNSASWGILHRAFRAPRAARSLRLKLFWINQGEALLPTSSPDPRKLAGVWRRPGGLIGCPASPSHQWAQVDLLRPGADPRSLRKADILKRIWRPRTGVTWFHSGGWKRPTLDLKSLRGKKVRLRIAVVDTRGYLNVGIDRFAVCC